jgi:putative membrane protein
MTILLRLAASAAAVWIATLILPGIQVNAETTGGKIGTYFAVAVLFGVVNAVIRPVIKMVGCSIYVLTLGLISFVVNGLLLLLTSWFADLLELPFHVDSFWSGVLGAIVIGLVGWVLNWFIKNGK